MEFYRSSHIAYSPVESAWGLPTSTLNFCEEDYEYTRYCAELFNTLTNLTYITLGLHGLIATSRLTTSLGPKLPYVALVNLGIASSLFHSTLKYHFQLCDEFSMLIATFIVFYRLLCFSQTRLSPSALMAMSLGTMAAVIVAQWWTGQSTVQQVVFTSMVYWLWKTCFGLIAKVGDQELRGKMRWMAISGIAFFITGHACWVTDFYACNALRQLRGNLGMPWAAALELHGYWHILTGVGVYIFMTLVECLKHVPQATETGTPRLFGNGLWPLMVYLGREEESTRVKKQN